MTNKMKEQRFRYPDENVAGFGRKLSCIATADSIIVAAQTEAQRKSSIALLCITLTANQRTILDTPGNCHQPVLAVDGHGTVNVAWNEVKNNSWRIMSARINLPGNKLEAIELVAESSTLYLPPTAAHFRNELWLAWPAVNQDCIGICLARKHGGRWETITAISEQGTDAFRPHLSAGKEHLFLAWDQYRNNTYEIAYTSLCSETWSAAGILSGPGERWLLPKAVTTDNGITYLSCLVVKDVSDDLGIVDHLPLGIVGEIKADKFRLLPDSQNILDTRIVADLREGLLPAKTYKGYLGLRRNPVLALSGEGQLWCIWERRIEAEKTAVSGHLVGRKLEQNLSWSAPHILHSGSYAYSVSDSLLENTLAAAFLRFSERGTNIIGADRIRLDRKPDPGISIGCNRWHDTQIHGLVKDRKQITVGHDSYTMFWADTHCHSNFSADAEGEVDEIIHFGRDIAGLDALCVIDNDYYPHKTLTEAEWKVQQELSRHFTREGHFVLFSGYEFTYHRNDLAPDFNHRCVIYPRPGGALFRRTDPQSRTDHQLIKMIKSGDVICYPHHCSYEIIDPSCDRNVEVCSSWRVCLEESDFTIRQLQSGWKFGFIGSSDSHRATPGLGGALTGIYARNLTPESLFDAYKERRLIATQGFAIFVDFRVADCFVGAECVCNQPPAIQIRLAAPDTIDYIQVIRDGICICKQQCDSREFEYGFEDNSVEKGQHWYFLKIKLSGSPAFNMDPKDKSLEPFSTNGDYPHNLAKARGVFAWTSPIWISYL